MIARQLCPVFYNHAGQVHGRTCLALKGAIMSGEEALREVERREYYAERERKNRELVLCWWYVVQWGVIAICLVSIAGHVRQLWQAL